MRIAHFTDLHLHRTASWSQLPGKRLMGTVNMALGRSHHFTDDSVDALVEAVGEQEPDWMLCTGDLTAMATPQEFEAAKTALAPLTSRFPFFVVPGNHDAYTNGAVRDSRFLQFFGEWSGEGFPTRHDTPEGVTFIGIDPCRPHFLSSGVLPSGQLAAFRSMLSDGSLKDRFVILLLHYPLRNRRNEFYGPFTRDLRNAREVEAVIDQAGCVDMILHGHEHHGFQAVLPTAAKEIPILDPGAGGYAFLPEERRTAHFNVYEVSDGILQGVERFSFDGKRFVPETGGAYATGR